MHRQQCRSPHVSKGITPTRPARPSFLSPERAAEYSPGCKRSENPGSCVDMIQAESVASGDRLRKFTIQMREGMQKPTRQKGPTFVDSGIIGTGSLKSVKGMTRWCVVDLLSPRSPRFDGRPNRWNRSGHRFADLRRIRQWLERSISITLPVHWPRIRSNHRPPVLPRPILRFPVRPFHLRRPDRLCGW